MVDAMEKGVNNRIQYSCCNDISSLRENIIFIDIRCYSIFQDV